MEWEIILYGIIEKLDYLFVIQKKDIDYSLWVANRKPEHYNLIEIEAYMRSHDNEGYSVIGGYSEIIEELKDYLL
jgi:hypothetical protein